MNLEQQDPTEKHYGDVGILVKYKYNNNNKKNTREHDGTSEQRATQHHDFFLTLAFSGIFFIFYP